MTDSLEVWSEGGSTYFGRFRACEEAADAARQLRGQGLPAVVCFMQRRFYPV